jgi:uncharacterized phosphosugar-binding protein
MSEKESDPIPGAHTYMQAVRTLLDGVALSQEDTIDRAAEAVMQAAKAGGIIYLFGTGHSHMLAEEGHYRAGGFAPVTPMLVSSLMIHESATASSRYERLPGLAPIILSRYQPSEKDVLFIFSNSGVNAVPVEMALAAREAGTTVIGILSREYCAQAPLSPLGKRLYEVVDIVIDNQTPPGDAIVAIGQSGLHSGPTSTIVGAFLLNAVLTEAIWRLYAEGEVPPVYISSNIPGAAEHNAALLQQFKPRNPHL